MSSQNLDGLKTKIDYRFIHVDQGLVQLRCEREEIVVRLKSRKDLTDIAHPSGNFFERVRQSKRELEPN